MNVAKYYDNHYFKYVLMFLSATNLITFVIKKKYDTIIFFIAISILTAHYTKSTSIILLISLFTSNLFNSFEHQKEGLTDKKESDDESTNDEDSKKESDEGSKKESDDEGSKKESDDEGSDDEGTKKEDDSDEGKKDVDEDEEDRIKNKDSKNVLGFDKLEDSESSTSKSDDDSAVGNNINYSATLSDAYKNLQGLLGKDGIKGLTAQTNNLLGQQKNLMDSLKNMGPIIDDAQNTLKGFDLPGITKLFNKKKTEKNN